EVVTRAHVSPALRPGVVSLPKGLWRRATRNGWTSNALIPDHVDEHGGGACYNDARVEVESAR
ncbi:MAG: molybdopterin dinucleotide binding domain-containing protein, partial [Myxococcota bacterium]